MPISDIFKCCIGKNYKKYNVTQVPDSGTLKNDSRNGVSYGLERYKYNAMLLFCQVTSPQGNRDRRHAQSLMTHLIQAFERYRFTVIESYTDLASREIEEKCNNFFECDFSEYGAVAVVILAPYGAAGSLAARDRPFHERVVLKYLTTDVPETLRNKPKIFITESNCLDIFLTGHGANSFFTITCYKDIMYLRIPYIIRREDRNPIQIVCEQLNIADNYANLSQVMSDAVEVIKRENPLQNKQVELICTFKKRYTLLRTDNEFHMKIPPNMNIKLYELNNDGNKEYLI